MIIGDNELNVDKYYRKKPIKDFDISQTMYSLVYNENKTNLDLYATGFMGNSLTYGELLNTSNRFAQAFYNIGVKEGDNVAILTISMPIVQQSLLALSKIGATMYWIDLRTKEKDLIKYINNCKVIVVFEDLVPLIESIMDKIDVRYVIVCSVKDYLSPVMRLLINIKDLKDKNNKILPKNNRYIKFSDFIRNDGIDNFINPVSFDKDRPSLIVQSSGSTGKPKQIVHTEYNFNSAVQKMAYTDLPFYKGNTMHISIPPFIIYGLCNSIYASMAFSMKAEMNPYVDEFTVYNDLGKFDISLAAPLHYRYIYKKLNDLYDSINVLKKDKSLDAKKELKVKLKELSRVLKGIERAKVFVSGGDKIGAEELIDMEHLFNKTIVNGYGNNECLGATIVSPMYANKPGSIGVPMKGIDVKIVDPETNNKLGIGEVGELYISSDNLFVKYLNNDEETNKIKVRDESSREWVKSGDLCYIDNDGYIIPRGRNRRLIKKEAFKICPDTIEEVIKSVSLVEDCVVVGVDDEKSISVPMAFVVLKDKSVDFDDIKKIIIDKCSEELPDYEIPSYFEKIDNIPYTPNDKQDFRMLEDIGNKIVNNFKIKKKVK